MVSKLLSIICTSLMLFNVGYAATSNDMHAERLTHLKNKGFSPHVIYDIGAYTGSWTHEISHVFKDAQFILFEGNESHSSSLARLPFPYFIAVLSDQEKSAIFYSNNSTGDSLLQEQTRFYKDTNCNKKVINTTTLAALVQQNEIPLPDLIKIDVQGAEKLIIQGSPSIITHAEVVILEIKILEYNKDAPLLYEMLTLMNDLDYRALDIVEFHYLPTGELNEIDILFVKKDSALIKQGLLW